ncbi:DUF4382 domain-containing protein [Sapientia aquatica]|uniref:DUF4382 domain-containing protein n=1 Tax=Sapientia aquatica TaxID=1549640 RepID=A0A4R5W1U5_9BURK|nr:DUF4382 domain-containing protein [Sapientia aquatica]
MNQKKIIQVLVSSGIVGSLSLMAACGGSSGNSSSAGTSQTAATGVVNMSITDGPSDTFNHVWVTVKSIAFHTDSNAVWSSYR